MSTRSAAIARMLVLSAAPALFLAGCAGPTRGDLDPQSSAPSPGCLVHQSHEPADRYTAGRDADTAAVLEVMRYYTANGRTPYCDGKPPTTTDRAWQQLYLRLGGDPVHL